MARRILIALLILIPMLLLSFSFAGEKVCDKNTPAQGDVADPDWSFSYASWTEPYASDALRYFYSFTNRTTHNVPVRWVDAGIVEVRTIPGQPITNSRVDAIPVGLLNSTIVVGVEGAGQKPYRLRNCLANSTQDAKGAMYQRLGTSAHFVGRVARGDSAENAVTIDVNFRSEVAGISIKYSAKKTEGPRLSLFWDLPLVEKGVVQLNDVRPKVFSGEASFGDYILKSVNTLAVVGDAQTKETLVILRVPVAGFIRR